MTPQQVIQLLDDPETLLRRCGVAIVGGVGHTGPNGQAQLATFTVSLNGSTVKGFTTGLSGLRGRRKDRPNVMIVKEPAVVPTLGPNQFNAYYIPMVQVDDVTGQNSHYTLPTTGQVTLALTSQITGCVFSVGSDANGAVLASHVQPPKIAGTTIDDRQQLARAAGATGFGNGMVQVRLGPDYGEFDRIAIVAKRTGSTWKFYSEKMSYANDVWSVRSVQKFVEV